MLHKDPTEFRERFLRWKKGELVYENGLALPAYEDGKLSPADAGMIKSKLAIASHFGNPTARRMTNYDGRDYTWPGEYEYNNGIGEPKRGNVYVGSYDNLVTPQIQDNGKTLEFVNDVWDPKNDRRSYMQSLKFNNVRDAIVFGENYKKYAPMMNRYEDGLTPHKKSEVNTNLATYVPDEDLYKSRYTLPEVTVTGTNKRPHTHAPIHYSKNAYKMLTGDLLGAMTTGMNVLSPSLWYGAVRDADGIQDGFNKLMRGNSGFVTEDYAKDHPYISAGVNLVGDAVIGGIGTKTALETQRIVNNVKNRNLFAYTYIPPYGYAHPVEKAKEYVSHILKDRLIPDPDNLYTAYNLNIVPIAVKSDGGRFAGFRDVAWRKYLGLNENSPLYVDNGDGTFSYNLDYILNTNKTSYSRYLNPEDKKMFTSSVIEDYVTGNGGNVASKIIYKPEGSYNRIEDIWDLHPFKSNEYVHPLQDSVWLKITDIANDLYSKNYHNGLKYKNKYSYNLLGGKLLNRLRYSNPPEWFLKSLQRFENMEMGPLLGGKPFTMRTDVPLFQPVLK